MNNLKEIKNKTLLRLAELKNQKEQVSKELALWKAKKKKAQEFSEVLYETKGFFDYYSLEYGRIKDRVEFNLYYQGLELFKEKIVEDIEYRTRKLDTNLWNINAEIEKQNKETTNHE